MARMYEGAKVHALADKGGNGIRVIFSGSLPTGQDPS